MINAALAPSLLYSAPWYITVLALLVAAAALGTAIWFSAFLIRRIEKVTWRRPVAVRYARFRNTGNVPGVFQLIASAGDDLAFKYLLDGQPLLLRYTPLSQPARPEPAASPLPVATTVAAVQPAAAAAASNTPGSTQAAAAGAKKLENDAKKALGKGRVLISIVGTLGSLIPGEWGKSLKDRSTALQADAQKAGAAIEMPSQKIQTVKSLQSQTQSLVPGTKPASPEPAAAVPAAPQPAPAAAPSQLAGAVPQNVRPASPFSCYVQTPPVAPDGEVVVELHIEPQERFRTAEWSYWLASCQVEQETVPPADVLSPQRVRQSVRIKGLPAGYLLLTFFLDTGVICLNVGWVVLFIDWLTRLIA